MKRLRHLLFVVLLLAQTGALTHAVEHLRVEADLPASHSCALCLAAQGLDAPLVSSAADMALVFADFASPHSVAPASFYPFVLAPRARAPPAV